MKGPTPKDASVRARRNRTTTAATLVADPKVTTPDLPEGEWHPMTAAWWRDVWVSPMAPEFDASDVHGLFVLARLVDAFWVADTPSQHMKLAAEIRQQGQRFGLSPIDRRRLQWEILRTREALDRGARRRRPTPPSGSDDPRAILRALENPDVGREGAS